MLDIAIRAAREAGHGILEAYQRPHAIKVKGLRDISTEVDLEAEATTMHIIREGCPNACFVAEESDRHVADYGTAEFGDAPTWYIDPVDGTTNYARGLPGFSVSVAMAIRGVVQCGAVYDPLSDHLFYAERGSGAFLNERRLSVSQTPTLAESLVTLDWPREQGLRELSARFLARVATRVDTVRSRGSAALGLCGVAAGWADAYFQFTLSPWDVAAGVLLVEEAGGKITDLRGQPFTLHQPSWLVSNGLVHQELLDLDPYGES